MGQRIGSIQVTTCPGGQDSLIIGPNQHRVRLLISTSSAGVGVAVNTRVLLSKDDGLAFSGGVNGGILDLSIEEHGTIITKSWHCFPGAALNVGILEILDAGDEGLPGGSYQYAH